MGVDNNYSSSLLVRNCVRANYHFFNQCRESSVKTIRITNSQFHLILHFWEVRLFWLHSCEVIRVKILFWSLKQFVGCHDVDIKALKILCQRQLSPTSHSCLIDYINLKTWSEPVFQCLSLQNSCTCHFDKHRVQKLNWSIVILSVCLY